MVLQAHIYFKMAMLANAAADTKFRQRCRAEVDTIDLFFPGELSNNVRTCFAAWLGFACEMDDILETLPPEQGEAALHDCIDIVQSRTTARGATLGSSASTDGRIQHMAGVLRDHYARFLPWRTCQAFFGAICNVFRAHIRECHFMHGQVPLNLQTYMAIRSQTISLSPFFEVIKQEYLPKEWRSIGVWVRLQHEVSVAAGLQNDLVGLERDLQSGEQLNAVVVLKRLEGAIGASARGSNALLKEGVKDRGRPVPRCEEDEETLLRCVGIAAAEHNQSVQRALQHAKRIYSSKGLGGRGELGNGDPGEQPPEAVRQVVEHIVRLCETHLEWCVSAERYKAKSE